MEFKVMLALSDFILAHGGLSQFPSTLHCRVTVDGIYHLGPLPSGICLQVCMSGQVTEQTHRAVMVSPGTSFFSCFACCCCVSHIPLFKKKNTKQPDQTCRGNSICYNTLPCVSPYISLVVQARSNITASGIPVGSLVYSVD